MSETPDSSSAVGFRRTALAAVLILSASLYLWNNNFPIGYHGDEGKKIRFALTNTQDFQHPLLLLQAIRAVNGFLNLDPPGVALLGRTLSAIYAVLLVAFFYLVVRELLPFPYDLLAALALGTSPILVVHAHYIKEDVLLTMLCVLSLFGLFRFLRQSSRANAVLLGLFTGLALSAHYKALLLVGLYAVVPVIARDYSGKVLRRLLLAAAVAAGVFVVVNYPLISEFGTFEQGFSREVRHASRGHVLRIYPLEHWFGFHLIYSIIPGMTATATLVALGSLAYFLIRRLLSLQEKILVLYLLLFHAVIEISPLKPAPGFIRYVLPEIPVLIYFAFKGLHALETAAPFRGAKVVARALVAVAIVVPLQSAVRLDYYFNRDTREQAGRYIAEQRQRAVFEWYGGARAQVMSVAEIDVEAARQKGVAFLVASSFQYDRYFYGATLKDQPPDVYRLAAAYEKLFSYPYVEFAPAYQSFAFSNPTVRVVDIRKPLDTGAGDPAAGMPETTDKR
jgi:4-amino-4-deoxy-L-arabinose transferase-like glycosyltransferase